MHMMRWRKFEWAGMLVVAVLTMLSSVRVGAASSPPAVPDILTYTGQLRVDGALYTGESLWRFAIVNSTGGILWTNDGSASLPPAEGVARRVAAGRVSIPLGAKVSPAESMQSLPAGVFSAPQTYLRAWVAAPTTAQPEELVASETPVPHAQAFTSVPYSHRAARAGQADEADHAAHADVAHSLTPAAAGQPVEVQGDLVVKGRITSAGNFPSPQGGEGGGEGEGKRGRVTFDTVTTRHLIVTDSVSLPGGGVFTSTVTQVQTLVVQSSVTLSGPAVLKAGAKLSRGTDALFLDTPANAITYTQGVGEAMPQIRTANVGSEAGPAATGATPLIINAGLAGSLSLNPFSSGNVGIGTDSPATRLHVAGALAVTGGGVGINTTTPAKELHIMAASPFIDNEIGIRLQHQPGGQAWDLMAFPDGKFAIGRDGMDLHRALTISVVNAAHPTGGRVTVGANFTPTTSRLHVKGSADDAAIFRADLPLPQLADSPGTPAFVVTTDGKVGIGTAGLAARLHIEQGSGGTDDLVVARTGTGAANDKFKVSSAGDATVAGALAVDGNTLTVDKSNHRVGVGTPSPTEQLHVVSAADAGLGLQSTASSGKLWRVQSTTGGNLRFVDFDGNPRLTLAPPQAPVIIGPPPPPSPDLRNLRFIGIGHDAPEAELDVSGNIIIRPGVRTDGLGQLFFQGFNLPGNPGAFVQSSAGTPITINAGLQGPATLTLNGSLVDVPTTLKAGSLNAGPVQATSVDASGSVTGNNVTARSQLTGQTLSVTGNTTVGLITAGLVKIQGDVSAGSALQLDNGIFGFEGVPLLLNTLGGSPLNYFIDVGQAGFPNPPVLRFGKDRYGNKAILMSLDPNGTLRLNSPPVQGPPVFDVAEHMKVEGTVEAGDVVVVKQDGSGVLVKSSVPQDRNVIGVISGQPLLALGSEQIGPAVAMAGQVFVKASTENGPIRPGDLVVTASIPGHVMKAPSNPAPGTIVGKVLVGLETGTGKIRIVVMLR